MEERSASGMMNDQMMIIERRWDGIAGFAGTTRIEREFVPLNIGC